MGKHITLHRKVKRSKSYCDNKSKGQLVVRQQINPKLYKTVEYVVETVFWIILCGILLYLNIKF